MSEQPTFPKLLPGKHRLHNDLRITGDDLYSVEEVQAHVRAVLEYVAQQIDARALGHERDGVYLDQLTVANISHLAAAKEATEIAAELRRMKGQA
jgi:hypothetical protein